jgi:hypothetical protein
MESCSWDPSLTVGKFHCAFNSFLNWEYEDDFESTVERGIGKKKERKQKDR